MHHRSSRGYPRTLQAFLTALIAVAIIAPGATSPASAAPPADFEDVLVADVSAPMDVAWTPDGRMLIINKAGQLRVYQNGTLLPAAALNLTASLCTNGERGLAGLAVHPNFAANHFVYLYYTYNRGTTSCLEHEVDGPVNRLSRFVLGDNNVVDPASETVLFQTPPMYRDHHTGGDVKFGKDGNLYVTVGDSGAQSLGWPQDLGRLAGKLVRITDSGAIPAGNPFTGAGTARCNAAGVPPAGSPAGTRCQEIFSYGFRNPFRFAHDPNAAGVRYYINDVGQHTWEDISEGPVAGGNYGWQLREGPCAKDTDTGCGSVAGMVDPAHWYHHGEFGAAATAGAFVPNGIWPAEYSGKYLFADYVFGQIYRLDPGGTRCLTCAPPTSGFTMIPFGDFGQVVSMRFGPDNSLYYVSREGSVVRKITYIGASNRAPTARPTASPTSGPTPLTVQFNGSTSSDPDSDPLAYAWDFDANGTTDSGAVNPSFTYTTATTVDARLTVDDGKGGTHSATVRIVAGNTAPNPVITSPTTTTTFAVGQQITLTGSATDPEEGALPATALSWEVIRHHATHTHPFLEPTSGNNLLITGPEPEDLDAAADSWLEIRLTATDSAGLSRTVTQNLNPKKVPITFATSPTGLMLTAGGMSLPGSTTVDSWQGYPIPVNAPDQSSGGTTWQFSGWSNGGTRSQTITTPATATTYTASFVEAAAGSEVTFTPVADSYVEASRTTRNNGTRSQLRIDGSPIIRSYLRFNVQGATDFSSARLRLFLNSTSSAGIQVRPVANTTWGETTITYANAPAFGDVAVTSVGGASGTWVTVDITGMVSQNGLISLALTAPNSSAISMGSRESANDPQLIVGTAGSPPPPPPPPPNGTFTVSRDPGTNTYRAVSSGTSFVGTLKSVVQNAITVVNGTGGSINFTAGDFDLGTDQFELDAVSDITFSGAGMSQTTIRNFTNAAGDTEPFDIVVGDNLVFRDMTVRAGGAFRSTSDALDFDAGNNILVERVAVTESRSKGIIFDGKGAGWSANGNTVRDCVITGIPSDGIELLASSGNTIEGCVITNVAGHGIQATKSSTTAAQPNKKSNDNLIRNNTVTNSGQDGVNINSSDRNRILSNTIKNSADITSGRDGIRVGSSDSITCNDNVVDLNLATDDQAVKTQSWGLNISSALCNRTVVGGGNNFAGNRVGAVRDVGTGTIFDAPPPDNQPPQAPTGLQASATSGCQVNLQWNAASDNVGVTGYRIYRGGQFLDSVGGATLTYSDLSVVPSTAYSYRVSAVDAVPLESPQSTAANITTPSAACSASFLPIADAWVDESQPTLNTGTNTQLRVDGSPVLIAFLKFNVQSGAPITGATLRIFVNSNHSTGFSVRPVADTSWGETTINASNDPAPGAIATTSGALTGGTWVEVNVSSFVTTNGVVSMALTTSSTTAMSLASRQSGANSPELVVGN